MNYRTFDETSVIAYLVEQKGRHLRASNMARMFNVDTIKMSALLRKLIEEGKMSVSVDGKNRQYFIRTKEENAQLVPKSKLNRLAGTYKPDPRMFERLHENRPEEFNLVTLKGASEV